MNKSRLLLILVTANVLFAFASVGAEAFFGWTLPPVLAQYEKAQFSSFSISNLADGVRLAALGVLSLVAFAAWIGLASFWRHGRRLYLVSWATWILYVLFTGPRVTTSVSSAFMSLDALVAGAILRLVYFSDLARRFERPTVADGALAGTRFSAGGA